MIPLSFNALLTVKEIPSSLGRRQSSFCKILVDELPSVF